MLAAYVTVIDGLFALAPPPAHTNAVFRLFQPRAGEFRDRILPLFKDVEQIVGKIEIALVDFVDQQRLRPIVRQQRCAQRSKLDEPPDVAVVARFPGPLQFFETSQGVVQVQAILEGRFGGDRPAQHRSEPQLARDREDQRTLAAARFAGDEQRPAQIQPKVDRLPHLGRTTKLAAERGGDILSAIAVETQRDQFALSERAPWRGLGKPLQSVMWIVVAPENPPISWHAWVVHHTWPL